MTDILELPLDANEIPVTPGLEEQEGYAPLPLRNLTVGWDVPFDIYLKIKKAGDTSPHFVKGCARGEAFREDWHEKLLQLHIPCVYVSLAEMDQVMQYLHHNLEMLLADESQSDQEKSLRVYDATNMWTLNFFNSEIARTGEQVKLALKFLDALFEGIESDRRIILYLMEIRRHSFRLSNHCLNVCLLGLAFSSYLGWNREDIRGFGLGALIHDIGLIRTPRTILEKKGSLTEEEMSKVKRHPQEGFRMMQDFVQLRWEALEMVLQHHENGDGSGYPRGLKGNAIHPWSRILRILDSYEAMTAERPWRKAMEPRDALWTMHSDWKRSKVFDQNYLTTFIKFLAGK
ncbi:MAG: HD domain-containing protein [Deltaproteobacteria bacterium]|nr:HD domain-containing protein [Deltaproteobacteria bacterium]